MVITWSRFTGMKFQPIQPGQILPYGYMEKSIFIATRWDRFPPGIYLRKTIDSHRFKNPHKMMEFYKDIRLFFFS